MFGGQIFGGRNEILLLGKALKFRVIYQSPSKIGPPNIWWTPSTEKSWINYCIDEDKGRKDKQNLRTLKIFALFSVVEQAY